MVNDRPLDGTAVAKCGAAFLQSLLQRDGERGQRANSIRGARLCFAYIMREEMNPPAGMMKREGKPTIEYANEQLIRGFGKRVFWPFSRPFVHLNADWTWPVC